MVPLKPEQRPVSSAFSCLGDICPSRERTRQMFSHTHCAWGNMGICALLEECLSALTWYLPCWAPPAPCPLSCTHCNALQTRPPSKCLLSLPSYSLCCPVQLSHPLPALLSLPLPSPVTPDWWERGRGRQRWTTTASSHRASAPWLRLATCFQAQL